MFEFICNECGEKFETLLLSGEHAKCPKCNNENVTKQFSSFAAAMSSSAGCSSANSCTMAAKHNHKCCSGCCHN
jgi:putative FmdB family regulatory protein